MIQADSQDPLDQVKYTLNWTAENNQIGSGVKVITSTWSVSPAGPTIGAGARAPTISSDGMKTTVWLTGGTAGTTYSLTNHVIMSDSPASERDESILIPFADH